MEENEPGFHRLSGEIELLTDFLSSTDFKLLRASDDRLSGGYPVEVCLERDERGEPTLKKLPL